MNALAIDLGNTRLKAARLLAPGSLEPVGRPIEWPAALLPGTDLQHAILESVAAGERCLVTASRRDALPDLLDALDAVGLAHEVAGKDFQIPMPTRYEEPAQLGLDRWLGSLAGWRRTRAACIVVGAGTALTIDASSDRGEHLGGVIAPGFGLALAALHEGGRLPGLSVDAVGILGASVIGRTTGDCIHGGLAHVLGDGLVEAVRSMREAMGEGVHLLVTGGDAAIVSGLLSSRAPEIAQELVEHLVLEGLAYAGGFWP